MQEISVLKSQGKKDINISCSWMMTIRRLITDT